MLVLIDESGCPGFKLTKGSSSFFAIAMVIFESFSDAEETSRIISNLRESLKVKPEFKFSKTHPDIRDKFFESVSKCNFKIRALYVNKRSLYSPHLRSNTDSFYNYFVQLLIKHDGTCLNNAIIKIDGSGDREFKTVLSNYLRKQIGINKIAKFKFVDSKNDSLIQLADMAVGAIARHYNGSRKDASKWFRTLKLSGRIDDIWEFR